MTESKEPNKNHIKVIVSFKDPDVLQDAVKEAVKASVCDLTLCEDELDEIIDIRTQKVLNIIQPWFRYGEYVDLEVDVDLVSKTSTVTVLRD